MSLKEDLRDLLARGRLEEIAELAVRRRRSLGSLVSLTFDRDPLVSWRAIEAMGLACDRIAEEDPECVRQHVRRLYWLITEESGGICWRAPEAMAEVVHRQSKLLADFVPIVAHLLVEMAEEDLEHFRAGTLWAIGRLFPACRDYIPDLVGAIVSALDDPNSQARGIAAWCLAAVGEAERLREHPDLLADGGPVALYEDRQVVCTSVGGLVHRALDSTPLRSSGQNPDVPEEVLHDAH
jgi:hypothetical protein